MGDYLKNMDFIIKAVGVGFILLVLLGSYWYKSSVGSNVKKDAKNFLVRQLEMWEKGKQVNLSRIIPEDFEGDDSDWQALKLTDYYINKIDYDTHYVRTRRGINSFFSFFKRNSYGNFYIIIEVELNMEDEDGYPQSYKITYKLEPRRRDYFFITEYKPLF